MLGTHCDDKEYATIDESYLTTTAMSLKKEKRSTCASEPTKMVQNADGTAVICHHVTSKGAMKLSTRNHPSTIPSIHDVDDMIVALATFVNVSPKLREKFARNQRKQNCKARAIVDKVDMGVVVSVTGAIGSKSTWSVNWSVKWSVDWLALAFEDPAAAAATATSSCAYTCRLAESVRLAAETVSGLLGLTLSSSSPSEDASNATCVVAAPQRRPNELRPDARAHAPRTAVGRR